MIIRMPKSRCSVLAVVGLALPLGAYAEERIAATAVSTVDRETVQALPAIDVREILPDSVLYTPGAVSTLGAEEIEEFRPYSLHDAFDFVPGVRTIDDDALGRRSGIGIRGAQPRRSRQVLLLEDGMPIQAANYLDPDAYYTPPMDRLERIDVLKGAGQLIHGPRNNHGIINFRNKRPTLTPEYVGDVAFGSNGTFKRHLLHRRTVGDVGFVVAYTGMNADGVFDVEDHEFDDLYGSVEWAVNPAHDLAASFTYFRERSKYDERNQTIEEFFTDPRGKKRQQGPGVEENNFNLDYFKGQLAHNFRITSDVTLSSMVFATDIDRPRFQIRRPGTPLAAGGYMRGRERDYRTYGAESRLEVADISAFGLNHTFQSGIRFERQFFQNNNTVGRIGERLDFGNTGNASATVAGGFPEDARQEKYQAWAVSGFVQDTVSFGDFAVTPGLRVEHFKQQQKIVFRPGHPTEGDKNTSDETLVLPGISLFYDGFTNTQLYAGVHRGYSPALARTSEFPLESEIGVNSQIGMRSSVFTGVSFEVAGFYNMIENTLVKKTFTDEFGQNIFVNSQDSEAIGVDVGLRVDSAPITGSALNFFGQVAYNYTEATFDGGDLDGNRVPQIPLHAGSFTLGVEHLRGWHLSGTVSHFGSFFTDEVNTERLLVPPGGDDREEIVGKVPSHTLLSARASYTVPNTDVTLYVQGRNLTNKLYISDVQDGLRPGAERTFMAGVNIKFR